MCAHCRTSRSKILCSFCTGFYLEFNQFRLMTLFCLFFFNWYIHLISIWPTYAHRGLVDCIVRKTRTYLCSLQLSFNTVKARTMLTWHSSMHFTQIQFSFRVCINRGIIIENRGILFSIEFLFFQIFKIILFGKNLHKKVPRKKIRREAFV